MKCEVLIDYLTFSVVGYENPLDVVSNVLKISPHLFSSASFCMQGYGNSIGFDNISVSFNPREDDFFKNMGICVSMSGSGCRSYEAARAGDSPMLELLKLLASDCEKYRVSRIDIACDDKNGLLPMDKIIDKVRKNEINSRISTRSVVESFSGNFKTGSTAYIGSHSSNFFCRIYDKAKQSFDPLTENELYNSPWNRCELVFRNDYARAVVSHFSDENFSLGSFSAKVINDKFSFIERDDINISRCEICSWWIDFIDEVGLLHLISSPDEIKTVQEIYSWLEQQVSRNLAVIHKTLGWQAIQELYFRGSKNFKRKHDYIIDSYLKANAKS